MALEDLIPCAWCGHPKHTHQFPDNSCRRVDCKCWDFKDWKWQPLLEDGHG